MTKLKELENKIRSIKYSYWRPFVTFHQYKDFKVYKEDGVSGDITFNDGYIVFECDTFILKKAINIEMSDRVEFKKPGTFLDIELANKIIEILRK